MVVLPVAAREVREASRQGRTYAWRWITAAIALAFMCFVAWVTRFSNTQGQELFVAISTLAYIYCLFAGALRTADVIAEEKRENTLGLLFLTDLKRWDIILGKLLSSSLNCFFGLVALLPLLAIPFLMGGVQWSEFLRIVLNLLNTLLLSISVGFLVSSLFRLSVVTISTALAAMLFIGGGLPLLSIFLQEQYHLKKAAAAVFCLSPTMGHISAYANFAPGLPGSFFATLGVTHALAWVNLLLALFFLPRRWQDVPKNKKEERWRERVRAWRFGRGKSKSRLRTRLLNQNPFFWLANREQVSSAGLMAVAVSIFLFSALATAGIGPSWRLLERMMVSWFVSLTLVHLIIAFRMAMSASYRLAEDRRSGALELLLATRISVRELLRGYWMGLGRQFFGPFLIVAFAGAVGVAIVLLVMSQNFRAGNIILTAFEVISRLFRRNAESEEALGLVALVSVQLMLLINWVGLVWVGMWLGLRERRPGVATWITLAVVMTPPWALLIMGVAGADEIGLLRNIPPEYGIRTVIIIGWILGLSHIGGLSWWARRNLLRRFRESAAERQIGSRRIPWPTFRRVTIRLAAAGACLALVFYGAREFIDRRGHKAWQAALAAYPNFKLQAPPENVVVPDDENLAKAPLLVSFITGPRRNRPLITFHLNTGPGAFSGDGMLWEWTVARKRDLAQIEDLYLKQKLIVAKGSTPADSILGALSKYDGQFAELREEAQARSKLRYTAWNSAQDNPATPYVQNNIRSTDIRPAIRQLILTIGLKTSAQIAKGSANTDDLFLAFRLVEGIKDLPASLAQYHEATLDLAQPIFDGLAAKVWSDADLKRIQEYFATRDYWSGFEKFREEYLRQVLMERDRIFSARAGNRVSAEPWIARQMPIGFTRQWQAEMLKWGMTELPKAIDARARRIDASALQTLFTSRPTSPSGRRYPDQMSMTIRSIGFAQTTADEIALACALERFRRKEARLPARLEELIPNYIATIPQDVFTGKPLHYTLSADQKNYTIYGVGADGEDNNGITQLLRGSWMLWQDMRNADWVWKSEPNTQPKRREK